MLRDEKSRLETEVQDLRNDVRRLSESIEAKDKQIDEFEEKELDRQIEAFEEKELGEVSRLGTYGVWHMLSGLNV